MYQTSDNLMNQMAGGLGRDPKARGDARCGSGEDELAPPYPAHFAGDQIALKIALEGAPVREPLHFHTYANLDSGRSQKNSAKKKDLNVNFVRDADGIYHGVFTPDEPITYEVCTEVTGVQQSGRSFTSLACFGSYLVRPLVAKLRSLKERAKPDRLEVIAALDVIEPGEYEYTFELSSSRTNKIFDIGKVNLDRGGQELTATFSAAALAQETGSDGPYNVSIYSLHRTDQSSQGADLRDGNSLTTAPYRRDDWDRGNFHSTTRIRGESVDPNSNGKFQFYRVKWDVVTPGGECSWSGHFDPDNPSVSNPISGRAKLAPGVSTIETDLGWTLGAADARRSLVAF